MYARLHVSLIFDSLYLHLNCVNNQSVSNITILTYIPNANRPTIGCFINHRHGFQLVIYINYSCTLCWIQSFVDENYRISIHSMSCIWLRSFAVMTMLISTSRGVFLLRRLLEWHFISCINRPHSRRSSLFVYKSIFLYAIWVVYSWPAQARNRSLHLGTALLGDFRKNISSHGDQMVRWQIYIRLSKAASVKWHVILSLTNLLVESWQTR